MDPELFAKCSLTLSEEISNRKDNDLLSAITELKFKIADFRVLTIEKDHVTEGDMCQLTKLLRSKLDPCEGEDFDLLNEVQQDREGQKTCQTEVSEPFEVLSGTFDDTDKPKSPEMAGNILNDNVEVQSFNSQDDVEQISDGIENLSINKSKDGDLTLTSTSHKEPRASLHDPSDPSGEKRENRSTPLEHTSAGQTVNSHLPQAAARVSPQKAERRERMLPHPPTERDKLKRNGDKQQAENISFADTEGVRGIKHGDHQGNFDDMSSQEKEMPEVKIHKPRVHDDSDRGSGAKNEGKVKIGHRINSTRHGEETARDGTIQAVTVGTKKANKSERKSFEEGHAEGSNEAMGESDVSNVDSLGSDTGDGGKCAMPNYQNKDKQSDGGNRESTEQVSAGQEFVEGRLQVQGHSSVTNQPHGMEQSGENDLSQLTQNHGPVVNQDMTEDVEMTPVGRSNTITETGGSLGEMVPSQGSAVIEVKDDQNAARNWYPDNLPYTGQQMRKTGGQHQGREPCQQSGCVSDGDGKHERELSDDEQIRGQNRPRITEQVNPEKSLGRPSEQMMEHEEEKAKKQKQAKHHSDDTKLMKDSEKQPYGQDRQGSHADIDRSIQGKEPYRESEEQYRETGVLNERRPEQHLRRHDARHAHSSSEGQTRINKWGESEERKKNSEYKHKSGSCRQQSADDTGEVNSKELSRNLNREDSEPSMDEHKEREKQGKMTGKMDRVGGKNKKSDNTTNEIDREEIEGAQSELSTQREINFQRGQPHDELEERLRKLKPGQDFRSDNADQDGNETESDSQSNKEDNNPKSASSQRSTRQNDGNPSKTFDDEGADLNDSQLKLMKARHGVEKVSKGDQTTHEVYSGDESGGGRYRKTAAQQTAVKDLEGREEQEKEYDTEIQREGRTRNVKNPSMTKAAKGQNGGKGSSEKHKMTKEQDDGTEKEKEKGGKVGKDMSHADQSDTESDEESGSIEYVMKKTHFRLSEQYFKDCPEHDYFGKAKDRDEGFLFVISDTDTKQARFLKLLRKLKFEKVGHVTDDTPKLQAIADQLRCKDLGVKLLELGSKSYLVGLKENIAGVKQKFISKLQEAVEDVSNLDTSERTRRQRNQPDMRDVTDSPSRSSDGSARPKNSDRVRSLKDNDPYESKYGSDLTRRSSYGDDSMEPYGEQKSRSPHAAGFVEEERYGSNADRGVYTGYYSGIKVLIHKTDITKLPVDCIVNAANTKLKHGGGVAKVIATNAGRELQDACEKFIYSGNTVPVTGLFVSPGGLLSAKHVLHAVGPKWEMYTDKYKCTDDLRRTVLRCLVEAMRLHLSSIALPSISAAIFKVPKELCARSYMEAVKSFDAIFGQDKDCTLKEIHFVDIDDIMVNHIKECFMQRWKKPCTEYTKKMDEMFCREHLSSQKPLPSKSAVPFTSGRPESQGQRTRGAGGSSVLQTKPSGAGPKRLENEPEYQVEALRLRISSKPALNFHTDLVIVVGDDFDKLSGIADFKIKNNRKPGEGYHSCQKAYEFYYVCRPGGKNRRLYCKLLPDPKTPDNMEAAFANFVSAIRVAAIRRSEIKDVKSIVLTSSILYAEPNKKSGASKDIDRKMVGSFARLALESIQKALQDSQCQLNQVIITGNEEISTIICKVVESRHIKKVDTSAPGAYPSQNNPSSGLPHTGARSEGRERQFPGSQNRNSHSHHGYSSDHQNAAHSSGAFRSSEYEKFCSPTSTGAKSLEKGHFQSLPAPGKPHGSTGPGSPVDPRGGCPICEDDSKVGVPVSCCGQLICYGCELKLDRCPFCKTFWRVMTGNQPDGRMYVTTIDDFCDGYEHSKTWKIEYKFEFGTQKDNHPHPGQMYYGTTRTAYIPANEDALLVLKMLKLAFTRRLTFTIGHSRTRNKDDVITWNDIHHKTSCHSGTHGYPDPKYLASVYYELLNNGVTLDSMTKDEKKIMSDFEYDIKTFGKSFGV